MAAMAAIIPMAKPPRGTYMIGPAESVCRPGAASVPVVAWAGCTTVTAVTVLRSPLAMVVVLWKVDVNGVVAEDELLVLVVMEGVDDTVDDDAVEDGVEDEVEDGVEDGEVEGEVDGEAETEVDEVVVVWSVDEPPVVEPVDPVVEPVVEPVEPVEPVAPVESAVDETGAVEDSESVVVLSVVDGVEELVGLSEEGSDEGSVDEDDGSSEVNGSKIFDLEDKPTFDDAGDAAREVVALEVSCLLRFRLLVVVVSSTLGFRRSIGWSEMATADARSDDTRRTARRVIVLVERQNNQQEDQRKRGSGREEVEVEVRKWKLGG